MDLDALIAAVVVSLVVSAITGIVSGSESSRRTIAALSVHIEYIKSHIDRHEQTIGRAHQRIDDLERNRPA